MKLDFTQCRNFGAGLPSGARGVQLDLHAGCPGIVPVGQCCDRCGRKVRIWVRVQGKLIGLCSWHAARVCHSMYVVSRLLISIYSREVDMHSNKDYLMPSLDPNVSNGQLAHARRLVLLVAQCGVTHVIGELPDICPQCRKYYDQCHGVNEIEQPSNTGSALVTIERARLDELLELERQIKEHDY